jgi:hypothetical protein
MIAPTIQERIQAWSGWHTVGVIAWWVLGLSIVADWRMKLEKRRLKRELDEQNKPKQ